MKITMVKGLNAWTDGYLTQTEKRHIKTAFRHCIHNNLTSCKVNTMNIKFDFAKQQGFLHGSTIPYFQYVVEECKLCKREENGVITKKCLFCVSNDLLKCL